MEKQSADGDLVSLAAEIVTESRSIVLFLADPERHPGWPGIVAKLPAKYRKLDELLAVADAARVARGDELHDAKKRGNKAAIAKAEKAQNAAVLAWRKAGKKWGETATARSAELGKLSTAWLAQHRTRFLDLRDKYATSFLPARQELAARAGAHGVRYGAFHGSSACHVVQLIADKVAHVLKLDTMRESLEGIDWSALAVAVECEASGLSGARISFKDAVVGCKRHGLPPAPKTTLYRWVENPNNWHLLGIDKVAASRRKWAGQQLLVSGLLHLHASLPRGKKIPATKAKK